MEILLCTRDILLPTCDCSVAGYLTALMIRHCCLHQLILSDNSKRQWFFIHLSQSVQYYYNNNLIVTSFLLTVQVVDVNASPGGGPKGKAPKFYFSFFFFTESHGRPDHNFIDNRRFLYIKVSPWLCPYVASFVLSRVCFQTLALFSAMNENKVLVASLYSFW